jgi:predicted nucleotidyltransferase
MLIQIVPRPQGFSPMIEEVASETPKSDEKVKVNTQLCKQNWVFTRRVKVTTVNIFNKKDINTQTHFVVFYIKS